MDKKIKMKMFGLIVLAVMCTVVGLTVIIPGITDYEKKEELGTFESHGDELSQASGNEAINNETENSTSELFDITEEIGMLDRMPRDEYLVTVQGMDDNIRNLTTDEVQLQNQIEEFFYNSGWYDLEKISYCGQYTINQNEKIVTAYYYINDMDDYILYATWHTDSMVYSFAVNYAE